MGHFLNQASIAIQQLEKSAAAAAVTTTHQQMDRFDRYATNVAEKLRDLSDRQQQQELMFKIDETILSYTSSLTSAQYQDLL